MDTILLLNQYTSVINIQVLSLIQGNIVFKIVIVLYTVPVPYIQYRYLNNYEH